MVLALVGRHCLAAPLVCGVMAVQASSLAARPFPSVGSSIRFDFACTPSQQCCGTLTPYLATKGSPPHAAGVSDRATTSLSAPCPLSSHLDSNLWGTRIRPPCGASDKAVRCGSGAAASTSASGGLSIELVPCLSDNYAYLLHDATAGVTAVVDPSEARPVRQALQARRLSLTHILNTHHHWDHTGGNLELKKEFGAQVVGPLADEERIPGIDVALAEGDTWHFGSHEMHVFDTPGHTRGHVSFYFPDSEALFTGDTLFSLGCGRLFEGTPQQMWSSLSKLTALPPATRIYCGHEYTQSNARFALAVERGNTALGQRSNEIAALRKEKRPTIPTTLALELATNPFLRPSSAEIREAVGIKPGAPDAEVFAAVRRKKDSF